MFKEADSLITESQKDSRYYQYVSKVKEKMKQESKQWEIELKDWQARQVLQSLINYEKSCSKVPNNTALRSRLNAEILVLKEFENKNLASQDHIIKTVINHWIKNVRLLAWLHRKSKPNWSLFQKLKV